MTPEEARRYIAVFREHTLPGADYVVTNTRTIWLDHMTDEEAVFTAGEFQRMEMQALWRRNKRGGRSS